MRGTRIAARVARVRCAADARLVPPSVAPGESSHGIALSRWIKASRVHPLIPYKGERWKKLYRRRSAVEREVGRLKNDFGLLPLRVRGIERVRVHVALAVIARLATALASMRATRLCA